MADDCYNNWGRTLTLGPSGRQAAVSSTRSGEDEHSLSLLQHAVTTISSGHYHLISNYSNGSDANRYAIFEYGVGSVLIAGGSYVSGDSGTLQSFSTSQFNVTQKIGQIAQSGVQDSHHNALMQTVALPYHIPGVLSASELVEYEEACLDEVHVRCLVGRLKGAPIKAIFLELVLASCGGELSKNTYEALADLARQHKFVFIVDEIMTGGRCGPSMLYTQSLPESFQKMVAVITLGKFPGCGIAIRHREHRDPALDYTFESMASRGVSTRGNLRAISASLMEVYSLLPKIHERREAFMKEFKCAHEDAWGVGCLIFSPHEKKGAGSGMKLRKLPRLDGGKFDTKAYTLNKTFTKSEVGLHLKGQCALWTRVFCQIRQNRIQYGISAALANAADRQTEGREKFVLLTNFKNDLISSGFARRDIEKTVNDALTHLAAKKLKTTARLTALVPGNDAGPNPCRRPSRRQSSTELSMSHEAAHKAALVPDSEGKSSHRLSSRRKMEDKQTRERGRSRSRQRRKIS